MLLARELNDTNAEELKDEYWSSISRKEGKTKTSCGTSLIVPSLDLNVLIRVLYFIIVHVDI